MLLDILFRVCKESADGELVVQGQILTISPSLNISIACNGAKPVHTTLRFVLHI